ncbi:diguanylate cyclase [Anatilimnocola sp. NA78]|uniref:diguanylate cyclase domain-containing protein n=1 Tax=Anatilimnocola sp. NA78 TaxID=3415683 RepID=UPI003CE46D76
MTTLFIEAAVALTAASAGAAAGWCFRRSTETNAAASSEDGQMASENGERDAETNRQAAKELLTQVHALTTKVSSQVGEHNLRVQAINEQLTSGQDLDLQTVHNAVNRLVEANAWMQQQLDSAESKLESQARLIESHVNEARTDALTGIANRRAFDEEMQRCLDLLRIERVPSCVMMIDVDFFKKFNDTHGHKAGDEVLRHVARDLKQAAGGAGLVCRYGGEEFALIIAGQHAKDALPIGERCRTAIGAHGIAYEGKTLHVNASAGLAEFTPGDTRESVLERSDEALYASKRAGRNCGHVHDGKSFVPFIQALNPEPEEPAATAPDTISVATNAQLLDSSTGLSSREGLREDLQRRLASLQRELHPCSLMVVQVDRLLDWKTKGGDEGFSTALRAVAVALRGVTREMDHAARFEEDAFAVAIHGANLDSAVDVAVRLRNSLQSARPKLAGTPTQITLSIGICEAIPGDDAARLLLRGQAAQNTSANLGGNQISTHDGKRIRLVEEVAAEI